MNELTIFKDTDKVLDQIDEKIQQGMQFMLSYNPNLSDFIIINGLVEIVSYYLTTSNKLNIVAKPVDGCNAIERRSSRGNLDIPGFEGLPFKLFVGDFFSSTSGQVKDSRTFIIEIRLQDLLPVTKEKKLLEDKNG